MALAVGDPVPDFTLVAATAESRSEWTLSKVLESGPIVLAFYPLAFTSTCTMQLCEARDRLKELEVLGARVFGFSTDTPHSNQRYAAEARLPFPLLSDPNRVVVERIWETQRVSGVDRVPKRGMMVVGADGRVKHVWITDKPGEWPGLDATLTALGS
ncbi:MAG TPA: redoxin domain-containing protein [Candidatus Thermoplasmatota archaeon]|nr:redoxin domain-containing protein [Candidatus Thermoplasmatota archaeon]